MCWVYDLPNWLFGTSTIAVFMAVGLGGDFGSRKWVRSLHGGILPATTSLALLWSHDSFVWDYARSADGRCLVELHGYGSESEVGKRPPCQRCITTSVTTRSLIRTELQRGLAEYCRDVINIAWPQQRKGIIPTSGRLILRKVEDQLAGFEPATQGQMALHTEALRQFNQLREERRTRLDSVKMGLSSNLWALVLIGAAINTAVTWFFYVKAPNIHSG